MERRNYHNPPIEEAICEFRFAPGSDWDPTIPGLFYEEVRESYTGKPYQESFMEMEAQQERPSLTLNLGITRVVFSTEDKKRLVAIAPNILGVHILRPYSEWEDFQKRIQEAIDAYQKVTEPKGVRRIVGSSVFSL